MKVFEQYQGQSPNLVTTQRQKVTLNNARRNVRLRVRIDGEIVVAGAASGAIKNGGSIAAAVSMALNQNGFDTFRMLPALMYRALAAYDYTGDLSGTRMLAAQPIGVYPLSETFELAFSMRQQARAGETAYIEDNRTAPFELQAILNAGAAEAVCTAGGGGTIAIQNVKVSATQVYGWLDESSELPAFRPGMEVLEIPVSGVSSQLPMDVKISERVSHFIVASVGNAADGGLTFAAAGAILNSLALFGSNGNRDIIIGPTFTPFQELVDSMARDGGPSTQLLEGIYVKSFIAQGLLGDAIQPDAFANLRFYFNCQPGAGLTSSRIIVMARTLERPPAFGAWQAVAPTIPDWAL